MHILQILSGNDGRSLRFREESDFNDLQNDNEINSIL